jgi:hypothetical protein
MVIRHPLPYGDPDMGTGIARIPIWKWLITVSIRGLKKS